MKGIGPVEASYTSGLTCDNVESVAVDNCSELFALCSKTSVERLLDKSSFLECEADANLSR